MEAAAGADLGGSSKYTALASGVLATLEDESFFISPKFHFQPVALDLVEFLRVPTFKPPTSQPGLTSRLPARSLACALAGWPFYFA